MANIGRTYVGDVSDALALTRASGMVTRKRERKSAHILSNEGVEYIKKE